MFKRLITMLVAMAIAAAAFLPAAAFAQTELEPPPGEVPVLYPPDTPYGQAHVVIEVDGEPISIAWGALATLVSDVGGWVTSSTTGSSVYDGRTYNYAVSAVEVPDYAAGDFLARLTELGRQVAFDVQTFDGGPLTVVVTLTDDAEPFTGEPAPTGRIDQALDTAGDVLLAIASFLIVAAAVVVPIAVLGLVAFAVWRSARRRWPIEEPSPEPVDEPDEISV